MKYSTFLKNIKSWWYNIFHKSPKLNESPINSNEPTLKFPNKIEEQNIFDEYKKKNERYNYLLQLQKSFENKVISEKQMNAIDKSDLEALYVEQINTLKRNIRTLENKLRKLR